MLINSISPLSGCSLKIQKNIEDNIKIFEVLHEFEGTLSERVQLDDRWRRVTFGPETELRTRLTTVFETLFCGDNVGRTI